MLALALGSLALLKAGIGFEVHGQEADPTFPMPQPGLTPISYGVPVLVWTFGIQGNAAKIGLVMLVVTLIVCALVVRALLRAYPSTTGRLVAIAIMLGPVGVVLLNNIGRNDVFVIAGSVLVGLHGRRLGWMLAGAGLMVLGNPEQAVMALGLLLVLSFTPAFSAYRRPAAVAFFGAFAIYGGLALWARSLGIGNRAMWVGDMLHWSLLNFFGNLPLSVYAAYGVAWIVVAWLLVTARGKSRWVMAASLLLGPFVLMAITADQTRVFVGVSTASLVAVLLYAVPRIVTALEARGVTRVLAWGCVVAAALPAIEITYRGVPRVPYEWVYDLFVNAGLVASIGQGPW